MSDDSSPANAGVHYPPPLLYVAGIAGGWIAQRVHPWEITGHPSPIRTSLAVAFALGWLAMFAAASGAFARHKTPLIPNRPAAALVTSGIYRYTRNPMYASLVLLYLAVTLVLDSWWPLLLLPIVLVVVDRFVIAREERYLTQAFPHDYDEYRRRVRRWM